MAPQQDDGTLCELCFSLNLTIDCFLGSAGVESSAQAGRFHKINLPSSNIIQDNAQCPFCRLLISAVIESNPDRSDIKDLIANGIDLSLEWIKDGRILDTDAVKTQSTRCLRLFSPNKTISDAYLVLLASNQYNKEFLAGRWFLLPLIWRECEVGFATVRASMVVDVHHCDHPQQKIAKESWLQTN